MSDSRNGYFRVDAGPDGTFIHFFPSVGDGAPVDVKEMDSYLTTKCIPYDKHAVFIEAQRNVETSFKLNSSQNRTNFITKTHQFTTIFTLIHHRTTRNSEITKNIHQTLISRIKN